MTYAIEVEHVFKTFKGGVKALEDVSLEVKAQSVFGLLGPNGAGKTTLVRILTTILQPDSGTAKVLGYDVAHQSEIVRRLFGLAGQYAAVDENLTGMENLIMIARLNHLSRKEAKKKSNELLEKFELTDAASRVLKTYSGGMRRRLDLAAALVTTPPVLFLDEPTTGLDPKSRASLWQIIEELVREGATLLLTTQYLEEADRLASEIAVVDHGRVIKRGSPAELKASLASTVLEIGFSSNEDAVSAAKSLVSIEKKNLNILENVVEIQVDEGPKTAIVVLRELDALGLEPQSFVLREPSLDDVFLALTGKPRNEVSGPQEEVLA